jgi:capsular exopolysaccharide synthesis family protein
VPRVPGIRRQGPRAAANAESYRILRSNLTVALLDLDRASVVVTSARAGEGKTSTTVNLARALALAGHRVVLVDLDLRHPDAHHWLEAHNGAGATDVLLGQRSLRECLQFVPLAENDAASGGGLYLLPAGTTVPNPTELLSSARTAALLDALAKQADVVLIDAPPVLPVADTLVIGRMVGGAVLVVETRKTPVGAVHQAKDALTRSQTRLLGVVVNKLQPNDARSDEGYGYGGDYPHTASRERRAVRPVRTAAPDGRPYAEPEQPTRQPAPTFERGPVGEDAGPEHDAKANSWRNGLASTGEIDLPWPSAVASDTGMVSGALPAPAGPLRAVPGSGEPDSEPTVVEAPSETAPAINGNGLFDGARPKRRLGRRG